MYKVFVLLLYLLWIVGKEMRPRHPGQDGVNQRPNFTHTSTSHLDRYLKDEKKMLRDVPLEKEYLFQVQGELESYYYQGKSQRKPIRIVRKNVSLQDNIRVDIVRLKRRSGVRILMLET